MSRLITRLKAKLAMAIGEHGDAAATFSRIYKKKLWSAGNAKQKEFWSGTGSTDAFTREYERLVAEFIREHRVGTVVDLGCGDFQIGQRILALVDCRYVGVDVVPDLIARNNREFGSDRVSFMCADISRDRLPEADLCPIRQVLQHPDNATIMRVLENVKKYAWILVTESQRIRPKKMNVDIKSGAWTRTLFNSGLYFDQPPFSRRIETLLEVRRDADVVIRTSLLKN